MKEKKNIEKLKKSRKDTKKLYGLNGPPYCCIDSYSIVLLPTDLDGFCEFSEVRVRTIILILGVLLREGFLMHMVLKVLFREGTAICDFLNISICKCLSRSYTFVFTTHKLL